MEASTQIVGGLTLKRLKNYKLQMKWLVLFRLDTGGMKR